MTNEHHRLRVLIIGAGRRVRNNFLPALACLKDHFQVVALVSPTRQRRDPLAAQWNIGSYDSIDQIDFNGIDVVAISTPTSENARILRSLLPHAARLRLVIDTPIATSLSEITSCWDLLDRFKRIAVAEDYMNFPSFTVAREAVARGLVGDVRWLTLNNIGFYYHGLALIRSFAGFAKVRSAQRFRIGADAAAVTYNVGALKASVIGPYRGHTTGGLVITGSSGVITQFPKDKADSAIPHYVLAPVIEAENVTGYAVEAGNQSVFLPTPELTAMSLMDFPDKSLLNLERGCGLIAVFCSFLTLGSINDKYTPQDAIYDRFTSILATKGLLPFDPCIPFGSSMLDVYRHTAGLLKR